MTNVLGRRSMALTRSRASDGELALRVLLDVALVVRARLLQAPQQVLALRHHEQRRRTALEIVRARKFDQRLFVLARVEQLQPDLVVRARRGRRVVGARDANPAAQHQQGDHHHADATGSLVRVSLARARREHTASDRLGRVRVGCGRRRHFWPRADPGGARVAVGCAGSAGGTAARRRRDRLGRRRTGYDGGGCGSSVGAGGWIGTAGRRSASDTPPASKIPAVRTSGHRGAEPGPGAPGTAGGNPTFWSPASNRSRSRSSSAIVW